MVQRVQLPPALSLLRVVRVAGRPPLFSLAHREVVPVDVAFDERPINRYEAERGPCVTNLEYPRRLEKKELLLPLPSDHVQVHPVPFNSGVVD